MITRKTYNILQIWDETVKNDDSYVAFMSVYFDVDLAN